MPGVDLTPRVDPTGVPLLDPTGDPFLRTRFALPARPVTFLRRERLARHLDEALVTPLTMVNGPAGSGKTLLVADWAASLGQQVAWLTTDAVDQRRGLFWAYLLQALRVTGAPLPGDVGFPVDPGRVDPRLPARLAAELSGRERPVVVVLDEYDHVTDPEIAEQLEFVLHHAGHGLRLIIVTRTEPPLPLHRYRAAGDLTEIRAAELAFTPEEAAELLEAHGLRLPAPVIRALVDRTRGWAAGLRLCALAARAQPDPETYLKEFEAGRSTVADYLLAEVLKRQPDETQDLLLRVSVLDRFCPDLANSLTGRSDAGHLLAELHGENAFVEDLGHSWYRLHPLFGEILRAHLQMRAPGLEPRLHRKAARWLRRSGHLPETLTHGAAAGDWEFTARAFVDDLAVGQLFTGLRRDELAELFSPMGPEPTGSTTNLVRAACDLARGDLDRGVAQLRRAADGLDRQQHVVRGAARRRGYGAGSPAVAAPDRAAAQVSRALLESLVARLTGSPGLAERAAARAGKWQREVPADLVVKHPEMTALLLTHLGATRLWAGRFGDARAALSMVTGRADSASTALPETEALCHLALIDYLEGWIGRAERTAREAATGTERFALPRGFGSGLGRLVLAAVAVDRDELDQARALLDESAAARAEREDPVTAAARCVVTAQLLLAQGHLHAARRAARPADSTDAASPWAEGHAASVASAVHLAEDRPEAAAEVLRWAPDDQPACVVQAARVQLALGDPGAATDMLDGLRTDRGMGPAIAVRAALVRAQAAAETGDLATARRLVALALSRARRERLRRPFAEAGPWLRRLVDTDPLRELAAGWLTVVPPRTAALPRPGPGAAATPVVEKLSGRERDVLERLARMMSTEEIAADLHVSVNTVKTHLKSAYRKLAVNRRGDAVRRARELRML
ncbi:LuxR C-terminal-related transcriptional regulator [Streptomyces sp. NPDC046805]|uniref:LuxR C-terminal-related transcriptional regulator n=1 Tax=Streptomyces sp. NPDC046805 TaxID=3155134 RepID=UPI0033F48646